MMRRVCGEVLGPILTSPVGLATVAVLLGLGGILWYRAQVQEAREGEALRQRERGRSDSMWNQ